NDLRNWVPTAPVLLCGGDVDPLVFWLNTQLMQNYWNTQAFTGFSVLDLEAAASANDPYANLKQDFAVAKALVAATAVSQGATDGGALAVAEAYHAMLVAPLCFAATRSFFAHQYRRASLDRITWFFWRRRVPLAPLDTVRRRSSRPLQRLY